MKKQKQEDTIDFRVLLQKFFEKWLFFAISLVVSLGIAYLIIKTSPRVYQIDSVMKMNVGVTKAEMILEANRTATHDRGNTKNIEDEILVIKSTEYVSEALEKLNFSVSYFVGDLFSTREVYKQDFPFVVVLDSSSVQPVGLRVDVEIISEKEYEIQIKGNNVSLYDFDNEVYLKKRLASVDITKRYSFGKLAKDDFYGFTVFLENNPEEYGDRNLSFVVNSPDELAQQYLKKLMITTADRNSNILLLSIEGNIAQKEIEFLNSLMEVVKKKDLDLKNQEGIATINFIDYQLEDVSQSLNKAERDMESFQYSTTSLGEASTLYAKRDEYEKERADLNMRLNYLKNVLSNLESIEGVSRVSGPSSVGIEDPIFTGLLQKLTELNQQRIQLGRTATEANPMVQRLDLEIKTTKDALRDKINGGINTNSLLLSDVNARIAQTNEMINRLPSAEIRRLGVQRKLSFSDNTYDLFLERKAAAAIALATNVSDWIIVEWAKADDIPISPNVKFIFLLAIILGLGIPASYISLINYFNNSIKDKNDLENVSSIPLLGSITKGNRNYKLATQYDSRSPLIESFRDVRINLQYLSTKKTDKVIGVTSSTSGEGKTFCSVNLGIIMAQAGKKILLIDGDLRKSNMAACFNLSNHHGLSTYLIDRTSGAEIVNKTSVNNLDLILSGPFPPNPSELLSLPRLEDLVREFKEKYDHIIIDTPPLGLVADYLLFVKFIDINIYIVRAGYTQKNYLEKINELYDGNKISNLSIIMNDVRASSIYGGVYKTMDQHGYFNRELSVNRAKKVNSQEEVIRST